GEPARLLVVARRPRLRGAVVERVEGDGVAAEELGDRRLGRVVDLGLEGAEQARELRRQDLGRAGLAEELHRSPRRAAAEEAVDLLEDARRGALRDLAPVADRRGERPPLDREVEAGGELDRAQDADRILAEADVRVA